MSKVTAQTRQSLVSLLYASRVKLITNQANNASITYNSRNESLKLCLILLTNGAIRLVWSFNFKNISINPLFKTSKTNDAP